MCSAHPTADAGTGPAWWFARAPVAELAGVIALVAAVLFVLPGPHLDADALYLSRAAAMQLFALAAVLALVDRTPSLRLSSADAAILALFCLGLGSILRAEVRPFAWQEFGIRAALCALWCAFRSATTGMRRVLPGVVMACALVIAVSACLEAYGVVGPMTEFGFPPDGLLGNRNRMAHVLVVSLSCIVACLDSRSAGRRLLAQAAFLLAAMAIVLSRSRAAWIAGSMALGWVLVVRASARLRIPLPAGSRYGTRVLVLLGAAIATAILLPNAMRWRQERPYVSSLRSLLTVHHGSGAVRLAQYAATGRLIADHPVLGVGLGNWQVSYGRYSAGADPSYKPDALIPTNRFPSSDLLDIASELGLIGLVVAVTWVVLISASLARTLVAHRGTSSMFEAGAALATLWGALLIGLGDPLMVTPAAGAVVVSVVAGAYRPKGHLVDVALVPNARTVLMLLVVVTLGVPAAISARMLVGDWRRRTATSVQELALAARWNHVDVVSRARAADSLSRGRDCAQAVSLLREARTLVPTSRVPLLLMSRCLHP